LTCTTEEVEVRTRTVVNIGVDLYIATRANVEEKAAGIKDVIAVTTIELGSGSGRIVDDTVFRIKRNRV